MRARRSLGFERAAAAALIVIALALCLCSCKPTDFFTEIVISPFSDVVDEDNPIHTTVNSPDATEESDNLSALSWSEDSPIAMEIENLVVYSSDPNTDLTTHHSIFDLYPLFPGIEASDGVRFLYNLDSQLDEETQDTDTSQEELEDLQSETRGGEDQAEAEQTPSSEGSQTLLAETGQTSEEASGTQGNAGSEGGTGGSSDTTGSGGDLESSGTEEGLESGGEENSDASGTGDTDYDEGDGSNEDPYAGYDGEVTVYNPGDAFARVPRADRIAVIGNDVAVLAQAIGGMGSICAMSEEAWYGAEDRSTAAVFGSIFASESEGIQLLWENDGSSSSDLVSIEALVEACGQDGVIVYDQRLGDQYTLFSDEQRRELYAANITLVPVELSTVQGIIDAAAAIGDALSESTSCANDSQSYAQAYRDAVASIVRGVAGTHGGTLASGSEAAAGYLLGISAPFSDYLDCPVNSYTYFDIWGLIATDIDTSVSSTGPIDVSKGLFFMSAPSTLTFWMQAAGITVEYPYAESYNRLIWPLIIDLEIWATGFSSSGTGEYARWLSQDNVLTAHLRDYPPATGRVLNAFYAYYGLGSSLFPYFIVCADGDEGLDGFEVKELAVSSISAYMDRGAFTPYAAFPFLGTDASAYMPVYISEDIGRYVFSTVGMINVRQDNSPFYSGVSVEQSVRVNPCGLLGSWVEGSMESVLEAVWLCDLYSRVPDNGTYEPINDMSQFSCTIGGITCSTTEEAVKAFYKTFYRVSDADLDAYYEAAVPDRFEDL